jgi:tripartite-type tricarboxylate transporter receptor subunit TctC
MRGRVLCLLSLCALAAQTFYSPPARAQFYANKTVTLVVNYGAGGNADVSARVFQRYLAKHLAGRPDVIVQDVPGAGGYVAMNTLGLNINSRPDGLTAGFFGLSPPGLIAKDPGLKVTMDDFAIIGAVKDWDVAYVRKDAVPGMQKPEDLIRAKQIYAGGYGRSNINDARSSLALEILGIPYKMITGFQGTADLNKAMLQNEINFVNSALPAYLKQAVPQIIKPGVGMPLFYFPETDASGAASKEPQMEKLGIPSFQQVYHRVFQKDPSGVKFDALSLMCDLDSAMHGVIVLPKSAPPAAVQAMRQAFDELANDREFADDYEKVTGERPTLARSADLAPLVARLDKVQPGVKAIFQNMIGP